VEAAKLIGAGAAKLIAARAAKLIAAEGLRGVSCVSVEAAKLIAAGAAKLIGGDRPQERVCVEGTEAGGGQADRCRGRPS